MTRFRCAAALLALAWFSVPAVAADPPLTKLPGDADVVIRIKAPKETMEKVGSLVDAVQPGFGGIVRGNTQALGGLIANPGLAGVDLEKNWYISVFTQGEEQPVVVFAVPTTDADAAKSALSEDMSSKADGDWLYYSQDEESLPEDSEPSETLAGLMGGESGALFEQGDISVFVNLAHLTDAYADQMNETQQQIAEAMGQAMAQAPASSGVDSEALADVMNDLIGKAFQVARDSQQFTIAANIADDGILIEDYITLEAGSASATALSLQPRSTMTTAAKLPKGATVIFGASADMKRLMDWGLAMSAKLFADNEQMKVTSEQLQEAVKSVKFGTTVGSFSVGDPGAGLFNYVGVTEVSPAAKWKEAYRKIAKTSGKIELPGMTQETTIEPDAETIGGLKADVVTITQEFDESSPQAAMQKHMQDMMFGPGGMKYYFVYKEDSVIQTMGGGKELMADAIQSLKSSSPVQPEAFRTGLIPDPNLLILVDVPGLAIQVLKAASVIPGLPIQIDAKSLDNIKLEKSFMGFSAATEPSAVRSKMHLPAKQFQSMMAVGLFIQQMQAQQLQKR